MISLKRKVDELERKDVLFQSALNCYLSAVNSIQTHAIEVVADMLDQHRSHLRALRRGVQENPTPDMLETSRLALESELAWYRKSSMDMLRGKEKELRDIIALLSEATQTLVQRNDTHSSRLKNFTRELEAVAKLNDFGEMRKRLAGQLIELKNCVGAFQTEGAGSIGAMQDELLAFRQRLDNAERLAAIDAVTGLLNRREGERRLQEMIESKGTFCLVLFDLDRFKMINDRYGHNCGDQILQSFARRLGEQVRPDDVVCRWGGDEFLVILKAPLRDAMRQASQVSDRVRGRYVVTPAGRETTIVVSASLGVAEYQPGESAEQLFERADAVMYRSKVHAIA
jgi:diguanylate cyclase (GGDEF)-like protein